MDLTLIGLLLLLLPLFIHEDLSMASIMAMTMRKARMGMM